MYITVEESVCRYKETFSQVWTGEFFYALFCVKVLIQNTCELSEVCLVKKVIQCVYFN